MELIYSQDLGEGANIEDVYTALEHAWINRIRAEESIRKLKEQGLIFEPRHNRFKAA